MKIEYRGNAVRIYGYVNAVERDSKTLRNAEGAFVERAETGVFSRALERAPNVELRFNHCRAIGSVAEGNLKLREDAVGLFADAEVTDPEVVKEARAGRLTGWSFGFTDNAPCYEDGEVRHRTLRDIDLLEVSILTLEPAYIATTIEARSQGKDQELRALADAPEIISDQTDLSVYRNKLRYYDLEE